MRSNEFSSTACYPLLSTIQFRFLFILTTPNFHIKENSWLAAIAARKLKSTQVAMVLGKTIHLHNTTSAEFLSDKKWLAHELCHVRQFKKHGYLGFLLKYLVECTRKGYYDNRFEVEAREAESIN